MTYSRAIAGTGPVGFSVGLHMKHHVHKLLITLIGVVALTLAACGSDGDGAGRDGVGETAVTPVEPRLEFSSDPLVVVLQIDEPVNQPDPFPIAGAYPWFTLYGDGTVVYRDRTAMPSALPPLMQGRVSPAGVRLLLAEAFAADVFGSPDTSSDPTVADGSSIYIRAAAGGSAVDYPIGDNVELRDFARRLEQDWQQIAGDDVVAGPEPFDFESVLVIARADRADVTASSDAPRLPIDLREADEFPTRVLPVSCVELTAEEFDGIRPAAAAIDTPHGTTWRSGTASGTPASGLWFVIFRPLFPHESGCALIADQ